MPEHELWLTALFNEHLAGFANAFLGLFHMTAKDPMKPWENWIVMELLVVAILMALTAALRVSFSVENPGKIQHLFEFTYGFLKNTAAEVGIHHPERYVNYFSTVAIFILFMNLLGIIPTFESPTMYHYVPAGLAVSTFFYYHAHGIKELGLGKHLAHYLGPVWWLAPLMIVVEVFSDLARPLSLTIRLFANMFAGEQITLVFLGLRYTKLVLPAAFMIFHVAISFLQAYIFTLLTMIYVSGATAHEH